MKKLLLIGSCIAFLSTLRAQEFYSTASDGGTNGKGTISKFVTGANTLTAAFTFDYPDALTPQGSLMQASNGKLYGMTQSGGSNNVGVLFSFDPVTSTYTKLRDFINTSGGN